MNSANNQHLSKENLKTFIKEKGGEIVAIASKENYLKLFPVDINSERHPDSYIENSKSIIVIGLKMVDSIWNKLSGERDIHSVNLKSYLLNYNYNLLDYLAIQTSRYLEDFGFEAYPIQSRSETRKNGVMTGYFPFKDAAVAAGIGSIGKHSLVISEKYGSRVRFVVVITNLELTPDTPNYKEAGAICRGCNICIQNCPVSAIKFEDDQVKIDIYKCQAYMDFCQCAYCQAICPFGNKK